MPAATRVILFSAIGVAVAAGLVMALRAPESRDRGDDDRVDFLDAGELIEASSLIVTGVPVGSFDESFEFRSASTGEVAGTLTERITTVRVTKVHKGEGIAIGEEIDVAQTLSASHSSERGGQESDDQAVDIVGKSEVVFFLTPVSMPPDYHGVRSTFGRPGEPGFGVVDGNEVRFLASERYQSKLKGLGEQMPRLTVGQLERLASNSE